MNRPEKIADLRQNYAKAELLETMVDKDPLKQFEKWFKDALDAEIIEPNAMCLSTVSNNKPDARIVLLKGVEERGFVFYTNYNSKKGKQLSENPWAHLNFLWLELQRQVRISGRVQKVSGEDSDAYFDSRPKESRLGALVSAQSEMLESREKLDLAWQEANKQYQNETIRRPESWGGYLLIPDEIEFWQGRPNRLHDRLLYVRSETGEWGIQRLYP